MLLKKFNMNYQKSVKREKKLLKINPGNSSIRNWWRKERKFTTKGATSQVPTSLNVSFFTRFVYLKHSAFQIPNSGKYFGKFQGIWSRRNLSLVNLPRLFLGFWKSFKTGKGLASLHKISINFKSYCDRNGLYLRVIPRNNSKVWEKYHFLTPLNNCFTKSNLNWNNARFYIQCQAFKNYFTTVHWPK